MERRGDNKRTGARACDAVEGRWAEEMGKWLSALAPEAEERAGKLNPPPVPVSLALRLEDTCSVVVRQLRGSTWLTDQSEERATRPPPAAAEK